MSNFSSMTTDELKFKFNNIDKIKFPKEANAIYDELLRRRQNKSAAKQNFRDMTSLAKIEDKIQGAIKLRALTSILTFVCYIIAKYMSVFLYTFIYFASILSG